MWGRRGLPLAVQPSHYGPGRQPIAMKSTLFNTIYYYHVFDAMKFVPDLPWANQEGGEADQ